VGEARLAQDAQIQSRFLAGWNTTLNTNLMFAAKARRNVENARLMLDSVKASKKAAAKGDMDNLSEEARAEIEQAEDEFVGQTEEAVSVMKNVCGCQRHPSICSITNMSDYRFWIPLNP
jgi:hypothetical protein